MKTRIITGVIAAALFIPLVIFGKLPFTIAMMAIAVVGTYELLQMKKIAPFSFEALIGYGLTAILVMPEGWLAELVPSWRLPEWLLASLFLLLIHTVVSKNKVTFDETSFIMATSLYVGFGFQAFIATREAGIAYLLFALAVIWATDSGAYFVGRAIGKTKLWPEISPNKTIEGAIGGVLAGVAAAFIFHAFADWNETPAIIAVTAILAATVGQLGDLVESAFKRHYNVKDSGWILPGHGGVLDRFDSLLFVLPVLHLVHFI